MEFFGQYPRRSQFRVRDKLFLIHDYSSIVCNADIRVGEMHQFCKLPDESQSLMRAAMTQLNLSARGYHRILKRARTIADLAQSDEFQFAYLAEGLQYRPRLMHSTVVELILDPSNPRVRGAVFMIKIQPCLQPQLALSVDDPGNKKFYIMLKQDAGWQTGRIEWLDLLERSSRLAGEKR